MSLRHTLPFSDQVLNGANRLRGRIESVLAPKSRRSDPLQIFESEPTIAESGQKQQQEAEANKSAKSYGDEKQLCDFIVQRVKSAEIHRQVWIRECVLAVAFYENRQWLAWDETLDQAISLMEEDDVDRYVTHNKVKSLVDDMVGLSTMSKPDATPAPNNTSQLSRLAASEALAITGHLDVKHDRALQMIEAAWWAVCCGAVYLKEEWDSSDYAKVAVTGPNGDTVREVRARIGDVSSDVVPPFEILIDPRAKRWKHARWIIHDQTMETGAIEEKFGILVDPDVEMTGTWFDSFLPDGARFGGVSSLGPYRTGVGLKRSTRVFTLYEKPTGEEEFPEGRMIVCTKDRLLYAGPMPLADKDQFPIARLVFTEAAAHPYGLGIMRDLIGPQVTLNRLWTKAVNHIESAKDTLLDPKMSGVGVDAYDDDVEESRSFRRVKWDSTQGTPPTWQQALSVTGDVWKLMDACWLDMQDIAGIHDANQGKLPQNGDVLAGVAIELLQQGDRTRLGLFTQRIEEFACERDTLDISLYAQHCARNVPRMMAIDNTGNPQQAKSQIVAFQALTDGGGVTVTVTPGSAVPKSAAGKTQEILSMFKMGLFDPTNPAAETVLTLLSLPKSDLILNMMLTQRQQIAQAMQEQAPPTPNPIQVETVKQQGAMQRTQMQEQGQTTRLQLQHAADSQSIAQKFNAEVQTSQQETANQQAIDKNKAQLQLVVDAHKAAGNAGVSLAKAASDHVFATHMAGMDHTSSLVHKAADHEAQLHHKAVDNALGAVTATHQAGIQSDQTDQQAQIQSQQAEQQAQLQAQNAPPDEGGS